MNICLLFLGICSSLFVVYPAEARARKWDIQFQWEKTPGVSRYEIEVARDKDFRKILMAKTTSREWIDWNADTPGVFYWHVRGISKEGQVNEFNDIVLLNVSPQDIFNPPPFKRSPAENHNKSLPAPEIRAKRQIFRVGAVYLKPKSLMEELFSLIIPRAQAEEGQTVTTPILKWEEVPNASSYEIDVSKDNNFKTLLLKTITKKTELEWAERQPGILYWRVRGLDNEGNPGDYSVTAILELVNIEAQQPTISRAQPSPGKQSIEQSQIQSNKSEKEKPSSDSLRDRGLLAVALKGFETWDIMQDNGGLMPSRPMLTSVFGLNLGVHLNEFTSSLYSEYFFSNQLPSPAAVQNQNTSGQGYLAGLEIKWSHKKYSISGSYLFLGQYQLNQPTPISQTSIYSQPQIFSLILGYELSSHFCPLVIIRQSSYNSWNLGADSVSRFSFGLGASYEFY